jgi:hypothetical protein
MKKCLICLDLGWVCENHPLRPWCEQLGCTCGDGKPCGCNKVDEPEMRAVLVEDGVTWH